MRSLLLTGVFLYVLGSGPAIQNVQSGIVSEDTFTRMYAPLAWVAEQTGLETPLRSYWELFETDPQAEPKLVRKRQLIFISEEFQHNPRIWVQLWNLDESALFEHKWHSIMEESISDAICRTLWEPRRVIRTLGTNLGAVKLSALYVLSSGPARWTGSSGLAPIFLATDTSKAVTSIKDIDEDTITNSIFSPLVWLEENTLLKSPLRFYWGAWGSLRMYSLRTFFKTPDTATPYRVHDGVI